MITQALEKLLADVIAVAHEDLDGPLVGRVEKFTRTPGKPDTVDVQPVVQLLYDDEYQVAPKMSAVPVAWQGGLSYRITWPIEVGSFVKLLPYGVDHGKWLASGAIGQRPKFGRVLSLSDAVAEPIPPWTAATPVPAASVAADGMVLFAPLLYLGDATAAKLVALDADAVNKDTAAPGADFASWMTSVEAVAQAGGGVVAPPSASITKIGAVVSTATKVKAK